MKVSTYFIFWVFGIAPYCVCAQQAVPSDTLLNHMTGKWLLTGIIAGASVKHDIKVAWVLGNGYIELKETSRKKNQNGMPSYEAIVLISRDSIQHQYNCLWLDNTSNEGLSNGIIAHAPFEADKIALLFKLKDNVFFHTTFSYRIADDSWHWEMTDDKNGKKDSFADAVMVRIP